MKTFGLEEAAAYLHVSKESMRDMAASGKVPAAKIGPTKGYRWVFTEESLEEFIREEIRTQTAMLRKPEKTISSHPAKRTRSAPPLLSVTNLRGGETK